MAASPRAKAHMSEHEGMSGAFRPASNYMADKAETCQMCGDEPVSNLGDHCLKDMVGTWVEGMIKRGELDEAIKERLKVITADIPYDGRERP